MLGLDNLPAIKVNNVPQVSLLGPGGVGKTCLTVTSFALLREGVSQGLYAKANNLTQAGELQLAAEGLIHGLGNERFPGATAATTKYDVSLTWLNQSPEVRVHLVDWRGQLLRAQGQETEVAANNTMLLASDALIILIDISSLMAPTSVARSHSTALAEITAVVRAILTQRATEFTVERPLPIAVVLTKWDQRTTVMPKSDEAQARAAVWKALREHFAGVVDQPKALTFVSYATLGIDSAGEGEFNPIGVEYPFYFTVWRLLHGINFLQEVALQYEREEMARIRQRLSNVVSLKGQLTSLVAMCEAENSQAMQRYKTLENAISTNVALKQIASSLNFLKDSAGQAANFTHDLLVNKGIQDLITRCEQRLKADEAHEVSRNTEISKIEANLAPGREFLATIIKNTLHPLHKQGKCALFQGGQELALQLDGTLTVGAGGIR